MFKYTRSFILFNKKEPTPSFRGQKDSTGFFLIITFNRGIIFLMIKETIMFNVHMFIFTLSYTVCYIVITCYMYVIRGFKNNKSNNMSIHI